MPKDFAKKQHNANPTPQGLQSGTLFLAGFLLGFFTCFLGALWYFIPVTDPAPANADHPLAEPEVIANEMQWDFYEIFPRSVVPVVEEYDETGDRISVDQFACALQAGSFQEIDDAFHPFMEILDHTYLNDIEGLNNPTSENICIWIWKKLKPSLPNIYEIEIKETDSTGCIYKGE